MVSRSWTNSLRPRLVQRLGEEFGEVVDLHPLGSSWATKVSCSSRARLGPHHVVEQQLVDVLGGESAQLDAGSVDDGLLELADFGVNVEGHCWSLTCSRARGGLGHRAAL